MFPAVLKKYLLPLVCLTAFGSIPMSAQTGESAAQDHDIWASLSVMGYGYRVKVLLNGVDVGVQGGKSESIRLFNQGHSMLKEAPPEMRAKLFLLKEGANEIVVDYSKTGEDIGSGLSVSLELNDYPAPVFFLHGKTQASAKLAQTFTVHKAVPDGFRPRYVADEGPARAVLVHVSSMGYSVKPVLNGKKGMALGGMSGSIPLEGAIAGKNELTLIYDGDPANEQALTFAIVTPEWTTVFSRKLTDRSERSETFIFTAK